MFIDEVKKLNTTVLLFVGYIKGGNIKKIRMFA